MRGVLSRRSRFDSSLRSLIAEPNRGRHAARRVTSRPALTRVASSLMPLRLTQICQGVAVKRLHELVPARRRRSPDRARRGAAERLA
jgi:hypothetical protein